MSSSNDELRHLIESAELTNAQAAELVHVSTDTVKAWLKSPGAAGRNPCPWWAVELLALKTKQPVPDVVPRHTA